MIPICLWDYIHHVRYHLQSYLFFFQVVGTLSSYDVPGRNVRKVIILDHNVKTINVQKLHHYFEIQHDVLFRRISVQWMGSGYVCILHTLTKGKHKTWHSVHFPYNPINFATFPFWHYPQLTHPAHASVKHS